MKKFLYKLLSSFKIFPRDRSTVELKHCQPFDKLDNLGKSCNAIEDEQSSTNTEEELHLLPFDTGPNTKELYNEMVRMVREELDEDLSSTECS